MQAFLKKITFVGYLLIAVLILTELASQIYVRTQRKDLVEHQIIQDYKQLNMIDDWESYFVASPYFGYTRHGGNNYGFESQESFPIKRSPNTFVIAFSGGSVANNFVHYIESNSYYKNQIQEKIPSLRNKDIRFMNLALPGYRQPQQFISVSYFIEHFDLLIQLDGWNEAWIRIPTHSPADFPAYSELLYRKDISKKAAQIRFYKTTIDSIDNHPLLKKSAILLLVKNMLYKKIAATSKKVFVDEEKSFYGSQTTEVELKDMSITSWLKYVKMEQVLLNHNNKPSFFFIQPSQYNPDSKNFTDLEKLIFKNRSIATTRSVNAFMKLRKNTKDIKVWDLANVFKSVKEDVYIDDCCHLNNLGHEILADEILKIVTKNFKK